jgi:hypothetical protein
MLRFAAVPVAVFVSLSSGCLDTGSTAEGIVVPTLLTVDPAIFLGDVGCGEMGLSRYVVTLTDVTQGARTPVPSSPPTGCTTFTSFSVPTAPDAGSLGIQQDHIYTAVIDGYDRADLHQTPGDRRLTDGTGEVIPPRWTTTCGEGAQSDASATTSPPAEGAAPSSATNPLLSPTRILGSTEVFLHGCVPLTTRSALPLADGGDVPSSSPPSTDADAGANENGQEDAASFDGQVDGG